MYRQFFKRDYEIAVNLCRIWLANQFKIASNSDARSSVWPLSLFRENIRQFSKNWLISYAAGAFNTNNNALATINCFWYCNRHIKPVCITVENALACQATSLANNYFVFIFSVSFPFLPFFSDLFHFCYALLPGLIQRAFIYFHSSVVL